MTLQIYFKTKDVITTKNIIKNSLKELGLKTFFIIIDNNSIIYIINQNVFDINEHIKLTRVIQKEIKIKDNVGLISEIGLGYPNEI